MKKLICALLLSLAMLSAVGCHTTTTAAENDNRFEKMKYEDTMSGYRIRYFRDKRTNIIYMMTIDMDCGGICPLYNADGEPMTYNEFVEDVGE